MSKARSLANRANDIVSVLDFGAVGDGVTDDTAAIQAAVTALLSGQTLFFPFSTYKVNGITVTGKAITIEGNGSTINCTGGVGAFIKTDHGNKLTVRNVSFIGTGSGINHTATPAVSVTDDLLIENCKFDMNSGVYAVYSIGTREAIITKCYVSNFNGGNGFYFKDSVSPFVSLCVFRGVGNVGTAINYPGTGTGYDAGLVLRDCEIMGWDTGLTTIGLDWLCIQGCTIDYNTQSIKIAAQDGANISNNYIGSNGANPALWLTYNGSAAAPTYCDKIIVENNTFTGHYTGGNTYDCILIDGAVSPDNIQIKNNNIHFYTRYGVNVTMTNTRLNISGNSFGQRSGFGVSPIYSTLGASDSGFVIKDNYFSNNATISGMNLSANCKFVTDNIGCTTKTNGQVTIAVGGYTTTFAHGITGYTPAITDVVVTPINVTAAAAIPYVFSIDATNCTINTNSLVATSTAGISYQISRYKA